MKLTTSHAYSIKDKKNLILQRSLSTSRESQRSGITRTLSPALRSHHSEPFSAKNIPAGNRIIQPIGDTPHNPLTKSIFRHNKGYCFKGAALVESKVLSVVPKYRYKARQQKAAPNIHSLLMRSQKKKRNDKVPTNMLAEAQAIQQQRIKKEISHEVSRSLSQSHRIRSRIMRSDE